MRRSVSVARSIEKECTEEEKGALQIQGEEGRRVNDRESGVAHRLPRPKLRGKEVIGSVIGREDFEKTGVSFELLKRQALRAPSQELKSWARRELGEWGGSRWSEANGERLSGLVKIREKRGSGEIRQRVTHMKGRLKEGEEKKERARALTLSRKSSKRRNVRGASSVGNWKKATIFRRTVKKTTKPVRGPFF